MSNIQCNGESALDCWRCGKYFSAHSSHYDNYYNCRVEEVTCSIGGYRVFKDEENDKKRLR